jgi:eukaryotic-like serine/threonine-protein kinase
LADPLGEILVYPGRSQMGSESVIAERFELDRLVGRGGMGRVFRATDRQTGSVVAVKLLSELAHQHAGRFVREARVLERLSHPGIVRHVAHGVAANGEPFLAMEWLEGEDLAGLLARGALPRQSAVALCRLVADALGHAHALGITHRDVKPSNLFLVGGDPRNVRVLDFGIARLRGMTLAATRAGAPIGTPGYMSPEQARGANVDARTDVFALGCVLHECLTGRPAFPGDTPVAVLAKVLLEQPVAPSALVAGLTPNFDAIVARMLHKDLALRLPDTSAVIAALGDLETASPRAREPEPVRAIGDAEQRRLFVVLASDRGDSDPALAQTVLADGADQSWNRLVRIASLFGARLERLAEGSLIAAVTSASSASDAAALAARTALALARELDSHHVALSTGSGVFAGALPYGEAIDRAAALLRVTAAGAPSASVWVDDGTAGLLDARFEIVSEGGRQRLVSEREITDSGRNLLGRPTPFVGRSRELAVLLGIFAECVDEPVARAVLVTAEPGVGKSRLRRELSAQVRALPHQPRVWVAHADPVGAGSPFAMIGQLVRQVAGVRDSDPDWLRARTLELYMQRRLGEDAQRVGEFAAELAGVRVDDAQASELLRSARRDPRLMADQMLCAWQDWIRAECQAHPVLIVLEDLHWGDLSSVSYVDAALRRLVDSPLAVVAFARPEVHQLFPRLWAERGAQEVRLAPLTRKNAERLARAVLGELVAPQQIDRIVGLSEGNAFYLEELIRAVSEGRDQALPESMLAMAQVRHEALEPGARLVLRAASVFGQIFWEGSVKALLGNERDVVETLARLVDAELIERRTQSHFASANCDDCGTGIEAEYAFRHVLLREAAYATLTDEDRALAHGLAAEWLEAAGEIDPLRLADHYERAGSGDRAARWLCGAVEQALGAADFATADALIGRIQELESSAGDHGDAVRAWAHYALAARGYSVGDVLTFHRHVQRATAAFEAAGDLANAATNRVNAAYLQLLFGDYERAEIEFRAGYELCERLGLASSAAYALHNLGLAIGRGGRLEEGIEVERRAIQEARAIGEEKLVGATHTYLAQLLLDSGNALAAIEAARTAVQALAGSPGLRAYAHALGARSLLGVGRADEAMQEARLALDLMGTQGAPEEVEAQVRLSLAEAAHAAADYDLARDAIASARARLLERAERLDDADVRRSFLQRVPEHRRTLELASAWLVNVT